MHVADYQAAARRTAKKMPLDEAFKHAALGCSSDMGEVASLLKADLVYGRKVVLEDLIKELGDVTWFIAYACDQINISMVDIIYNPHTDERFMSSRTVGQDAIYWVLMGMKAAGDFTALVATGCDQHTHKHQVMDYLTRLYTCVYQVGHKYGIDIGVVFVENIHKLRRRYPDAYSDEAAIARRDEKTK